MPIVLQTARFGEFKEYHNTVGLYCHVLIYCHKKYKSRSVQDLLIYFFDILFIDLVFIQVQGRILVTGKYNFSFFF